MVIPADRSGLLTTSETEKAIALIRNSVNVRDPYEITYIYIYQSTIDIGETPRIWVSRLGADSEIVELTPDMIEGVFDNTVVGTHDITIVYGGKS